MDFVAKVEIGVPMFTTSTEMRVIEVMRGPAVTRVTGFDIMQTSCDSIPRKGEIGVVAGQIVSIEGKHLTILLIRGPSEQELANRPKMPFGLLPKIELTAPPIKP